MAFKLASKSLLSGYGAVAGFAVLTAGLVVVHGAGLLNLGFPVLATILAFYLFLSHRNVYVAFVWWIWLVSPLVRRLVDYQTGYHSVSPVMLSPLLVTVFASLPVLLNPRFVLKRSVTPFLMVTIVYIYGLVTGCLSGSVAAALFDFASSAAPLGFAWFLMTDSKGYTENRKAFLFSSNLGLLLISLYGLYQFYQMPAWDAFWLRSSNFASAGKAIAEQIRLFGPLNSPGPYGAALMLSLVYVLVTKGPLRIAAGGVGFPAFGLSLVRSSWLGWAAAAIYLVIFAGGKTRIRIVWLAFVLALVAYPIVTVGPVADTLAKRLASFNHLQQDRSYVSRQEIYEYTTVNALSNPVGAGFGGNGVGTKLSDTPVAGFDSGILQIPFEFGWIFGALYFWALLAIGFNITTSARKTSDSIVIASAGIYLALIVENIGAPTWGGVYGMTMWIGAAFATGPIAGFVPRKARFSTGAANAQLAASPIVHGN